MKSKGFTVATSFLAGSSGAQRFYLGQDKKGWMFLLICWILFPAIIYAVKYFDIPPYWQWAVTFWILIIAGVHISEGIRFIRTKNEKFISGYTSKGSSVFLTAISVIVTFCFGYGLINLLSITQEIDIDHASPSYTLTSVEYSNAFKNDEKAFMSLYHNKVIRVNGRVASLGSDFVEGNIILLNVTPDASDLQCYFNKEHQQALNTIKKGDSVIVIGVCEDGRFLRNCKIAEHIVTDTE